jgi:hypothetical protein
LKQSPPHCWKAPLTPYPPRQSEPATVEPTQPERRTGQALIDAFAEIGGLLSDEEIDRMFTRNSAGARPVDLS